MRPKIMTVDAIMAAACCPWDEASTPSLCSASWCLKERNRVKRPVCSAVSWPRHHSQAKRRQSVHMLKCRRDGCWF